MAEKRKEEKKETKKHEMKDSKKHKDGHTKDCAYGCKKKHGMK